MIKVNLKRLNLHLFFLPMHLLKHANDLLPIRYILHDICKNSDNFN